MIVTEWNVPGHINVQEFHTGPHIVFNFYNSQDGSLIGYILPMTAEETDDIRNQLTAGIDDAYDFAMNYSYFGLQ